MYYTRLLLSVDYEETKLKEYITKDYVLVQLYNNSHSPNLANGKRSEWR